VAVASAGLYADNHANISPLSFFTGRMPFLTPNQQRQSTEGLENEQQNNKQLIRIIKQ